MTLKSIHHVNILGPFIPLMDKTAEVRTGQGDRECGMEDSEGPQVTVLAVPPIISC